MIYTLFAITLWLTVCTHLTPIPIHTRSRKCMVADRDISPSRSLSSLETVSSITALTYRTDCGWGLPSRCHLPLHRQVTNEYFPTPHLTHDLVDSHKELQTNLPTYGNAFGITSGGDDTESCFLLHFLVWFVLKSRNIHHRYHDSR